MRARVLASILVFSTGCVLVPPDFTGFACDADHDCDGQACVDGLCVPRCGDDDECGAGRRCQGGGCVLVPSEGEPAGCVVPDAERAVAFEGHCYAAFSVVEDFAAAARRCAARGGTLAIPGDDAEQQFLTQQMLLPDVEPFLGVTDVALNGLFRTLSGEPLPDPPPFADGEPNDFGGNEDCVVLLPEGWNDDSCVGGNDSAALCELPLDDVDLCGDGALQPALGEACDDDAGCPADCSGTLDGATVAHVFAGDTLFAAFADPLPFFAARDACRILGGELAIPTTNEENAAVHRAATILQLDAWIGYTDDNDAAAVAGEFVRVDTGAPIGGGFANFDDGEPSDDSAADCVELDASDGRWDDDACDTDQAFVCAF